MVFQAIKSFSEPLLLHDFGRLYQQPADQLLSVLVHRITSCKAIRRERGERSRKGQRQRIICIAQESIPTDLFLPTSLHLLLLVLTFNNVLKTLSNVYDCMNRVISSEPSHPNHSPNVVKYIYLCRKLHIKNNTMIKVIIIIKI